MFVAHMNLPNRVDLTRMYADSVNVKHCTLFQHLESDKQQPVQ